MYQIQEKILELLKVERDKRELALQMRCARIRGRGKV